MQSVKHVAVRLGELLRTAKKRPLDGQERAEYEKLQRDLAEAYQLAQKLMLPPGQAQRKSRRVAHMLRVTVTSPGNGVRETTSTMNLSSGGFAALMADALARRQQVDFALRTNLGVLEGKARVVSVLRRERTYLASFSIEEMSESAREALDVVVLEQVLQRLAK